MQILWVKNTFIVKITTLISKINTLNQTILTIIHLDVIKHSQKNRTFKNLS